MVFGAPPFEHPSHALKIHGVAVYLIKLTIPESYPAIRLVGAMTGQDVIEVGQLCCVGRESLPKLIGRRLPEGEILRNLVRRAEVHAAGTVVVRNERVCGRQRWFWLFRAWRVGGMVQMGEEANNTWPGSRFRSASKDKEKIRINT